jgi:tripartite-type tricarboxylate transporter receptor subunit TctC
LLLEVQVKFAITIMGAALALVAAAEHVVAETFPLKPIRIIVTSAAGGLLDSTTRIVTQHMSTTLGQPIVVENRSGAGGLIAIRGVKSAPADGYTLLATPNTIAIQQSVSLDPGYDVEKDFSGVAPMTRAPHLLLVPPGGPDQTLADFIARAKASPGRITYASAGVGTSTHLGAAAFAQRSGLNLSHVPYKGNPAAWPDLMAGRVGMIFEPYGSGAAMIQSGKLKALGVASMRRLEALPDMPTISELGVTGFTANSWFGLLAPAGTPKAIVKKLSAAVQAALNSDDLKARFRNEGSEPMLMSPEEFDSFLKAEVAAMAKLVTDAGVPKQ